MLHDDRYDSLIQYYWGTYGRDWLLGKAQLKQESAFDPNAKSKCGALGLAQFMKKTWAEWWDGTPGIQPVPPDVNPIEVDPRNPESSIQAQAAYMDWLLKIFHDDAELALAAYNAGPGTVMKLRQDSLAGFELIAPKLPLETRDYVERIMTFYHQYQGAAS